MMVGSIHARLAWESIPIPNARRSPRRRARGKAMDLLNIDETVEEEVDLSAGHSGTAANVMGVNAVKPQQAEETGKDFENPEVQHRSGSHGKLGHPHRRWLYEHAKKAVVNADHTHIAFPRRSFSRTRRSDSYGSVQVVRTEEWPEGWGYPIPEEGNKILERVLALIYLIEDAGKTWSMENPEHSFAWDHSKMTKVLKLKHVHNVALDQCPYMVHTQQRTTSASWMARVKLRCKDARPHFHLPGGLVGKTWGAVAQGMVLKTSRAAEYPFGLCHAAP